MEILKNIANLLKVKTIVTMVVMAVFTVLALRGDITADNAMIIITIRKDIKVDYFHISTTFLTFM